MTLWEKYIDTGINHPMGHYGCADMVAYHRAMDVLKHKGEMNFHAWICDAVEFANKLTGYGKVRDIAPYLMAFGDGYGLAWFTYQNRRATSAEIDEYNNWKDITVAITPKGYFSEPNEWFETKEDFKSPSEDFDSFLEFTKEVDNKILAANQRDENGLTES